MNIDHKRGDTLALDLARVDAAGAPIDLTGATIAARVAFSDFAADLDVTVTNAAAGEYTLTATAAQTALWPVARLRADVKYSAAGLVRRSITFAITVVEEVTP
ncbi:hypothetical protein R5H32_15940 [Defluviimonas sp. D31]|uniref:hypothetical protein n=1 Tax=Defluviimonas sp. D31 TaxID=3083253 RepID=UPI00296FA6A6|nr:hypothetical protein [Defluviimonas sp. D31]MDW4550853.1 hypothetical protein [Defluviimonas sp. D31]